MQIAIGADHAGFQLKQHLADELRRLGHVVLDVGTHSEQPADYPDSAEAVGLAVTTGQAQRGILVCGSGIGTCIAANKLPGVRAGLCHSLYAARQGVMHDDMNILVLGARLIDTRAAKEYMQAFLTAKFSAEARHVRRRDKVTALEQRYHPDSETARSTRPT